LTIALLLIAAVAVFVAAPSQPAVERPLAAIGRQTTSTTVASTTTSAPADERSVGTTEGPAGAPDAAVTAPTPDSTLVAADTCPPGEPVAAVVDGLLQLTNPTKSDVVVTAITVGTTVLRTPITVPAGATVSQAMPASVGEPVIDEWDWASAPVARSCPS
jgi:hypothetical protein